jgi:MoxR-like ATPase
MVHTVERPPGEPPPVELPDLGALPAVYGPLFGRDDDLDRAAGLIAAERRPVLTVVGPGGVGKTRLAIALGQRLRNDFADGVRFVPPGR